MPIFQYEPYRNAYGPSIAEALGQEGRIQAAGALQAGDLQADAARRSGALQANMWGTLGNAFTAIPQELRANREAARRDELQGMQLDAARREQKTRQVLEQELGNPQNYHPDGRLNEAQVLPRLQQLDLGAYQQVAAMAAKRQQDALTQRKTLSDLAVSEATLDEKAAKRAAESQENLGKAAFTAGQELQPDQPLQGRDYATQLVNRAVASGSVAPADANQFYLALARAKPDEVGAILQGATAPDLRAKIEKEQSEALRARAEAAKSQAEALGGKPLTGEERIANLMGREAAGETLNAADKAALEGWRLKEGSKPFTVKTVENGRPVERVMTTADAMKHGLFASPPTAAAQNAETALVRVEHQDDQGNTVVEWMPKSEVRGQTFKKGTSAALQNRLASATAVNQTGNDIIAALSDPATARTVGPVMGRYNSLREFIGNPPPELAELAGQIESYALANMGVHGMRSVEGAAKINKMLDSRTTPAALIATIKGLQGFSTHLLENEGRAVPPPAAKTAPNTSGTTTPPGTTKSAADLLTEYWK